MMHAAIAIGSNSTRLLAARKQAGALTDIFRGREETRLFLGLDEQGNIRPERLEETAQAVARLAALARGRGADSIALFATSASRDAKNSDALARRIYALTGLTLRIISGQEEARLGFLAAAGQARRLVMDIGGGSTELTLGEKGHVLWAESAQLGASRLLKEQPIACLADAQRARARAETLLRPFCQALQAYPPAPALIGLGGTCTTAAAMRLGREAHGETVEGLRLSRDFLQAQWTLLAELPLEKRMQVPGLPPARAIHMPHGLSILLAAMALLHFDEITVSARTNLDGFLLEQEE